jgi:hypothetical protein
MILLAARVPSASRASSEATAKEAINYDDAQVEYGTAQYAAKSWKNALFLEESSLTFHLPDRTWEA